MGAVRQTARLSFALLVSMLSANAEAQGLIRYVASSGNDGNPCTRTQPCRTLQSAVNAAPSGGEVQVLDSGEFGAGATIGKAVTISAVGVAATVTGTITINAPTNAAVVLRGLHLNGSGGVGHGIRIVQAKSIHIKNCMIERFDEDGISGIYTSSAVGSISIFVAGSISRDNGANGLSIDNDIGQLDVQTVISDSQFVNNGRSGLYLVFSETTATNTIASGNFTSGILASAGRAAAGWSISANNGQYGFAADLGGGEIFTSTAEMTLSQSVARGNQSGLFVLSFANLIGVMRLSNSVVTNNGTGIVNAGVVETRQNNTVSGNGTNRSGPPLTPISPM